MTIRNGRSGFINPSATQEWTIYPDEAIIRVHHNIFEIRRCPICQHKIDQAHDKATIEDKERTENITGFALV